MKRLIVILILLSVVLTGFLYLGISSVQSFSKSVLVACTNEGMLRVLAQDRIEKNGWPGKRINDSTYTFHDVTYIIGSNLINTNNLHFVNHGKGQLVIEETTPDSSSVTLQVYQQLSLSPLQRIKEFIAIQKTKKIADDFLAELQKNFSGEELVYGIKINMSRVTDSAMISTRTLLNHYPSVSEVYSMIDTIRGYIKNNGGKEGNAPMLNVFEEGANQYLVMVAVPTTTYVQGNETFLQKRMLANGYILVSEVTGGNYTIAQAEKAMQQYVMDHHKSSPAIPFQMLLTDRRAEPDTSKWKTRIYYPVMY